MCKAADYFWGVARHGKGSIACSGTAAGWSQMGVWEQQGGCYAVVQGSGVLSWVLGRLPLPRKALVPLASVQRAWERLSDGKDTAWR